MNIFDLEQEILKCWGVTDDIQLLTQTLFDDPKFVDTIDPKAADFLMNKLGAIAELYDMKFDKLWKTFEAHSKEFHEYRRAYEGKNT